MKELSIEEKAKAYDEAIERAKKWYNAPNVDKIPTFGNRVIEEIFPELRESEDERIRKALIWHLTRVDNEIPLGAYHSIDGIEIKDMLAWLEKQGEKEYDWSEESYDDARLNDIVSKVKCGLQLNKAEINWLKSIKEKLHEEIHYWTEEEIEPIISDYLRGTEHYGGMIGRLRCLKPKSLEKQGNQKPVDKVEPKKLKFKAGDRVIGIVSGIQYYITEVCDDYYNTESGCIIMFCAQDNFELYKQNPAWSEDDECYLNTTIAYLKDAKEFKKTAENCINWLKSLKDRVQPQPKQEWSEWDRILQDSSISYLCNLRDTFETKRWDKEQIQKCINWLKSLSSEQVEAE